MTPGDLKQQLDGQLETMTGEMLLFGLLGKLIYTYPAKEWIQELLQEDVFVESPFAGHQAKVEQGLQHLQAWSQAAAQLPIARVVRELEEDYQRLFVGMGEIAAPPWESVYRTKERLLFQEPTLQVRAWYRRFSLEIEKLGNEPDDHAGLELVFLAHLASLAFEALGQGEETRAAEIVQAQREFLQDHILEWMPQWCADVIQNARTDFYRGIALVLSGALEEAAALMEFDLQEKVK